MFTFWTFPRNMINTFCHLKAATDRTALHYPCSVQGIFYTKLFAILISSFSHWGSKGKTNRRALILVLHELHSKAFSSVIWCVSLYQIPKMSGRKGRKLRFHLIFLPYCLGRRLRFSDRIGSCIIQNLPLCHTHIWKFSTKFHDIRQCIKTVRRFPVASEIPFHSLTDHY